MMVRLKICIDISYFMFSFASQFTTEREHWPDVEYPEPGLVVVDGVVDLVEAGARGESDAVEALLVGVEEDVVVGAHLELEVTLEIWTTIVYTYLQW